MNKQEYLAKCEGLQDDLRAKKAELELLRTEHLNEEKELEDEIAQLWENLEDLEEDGWDEEEDDDEEEEE